MPIITLTSDLGLKDYYVASIKGAILRQCPAATIVDISHQVSKFNISQAAFILENAYREFPENTIHIVGVLPERTKEKAHVAVFCDQHYFIAVDNGILPLALDKKPDQIIELKSIETLTANFPLKDIFVKAACHIANGGKIEDLGKPKTQLLRSIGFRPVVNENTLRGSVIYIDDFGNVIINIREQLFRQRARGRRFSISVRSGGHSLNSICSAYSDVPPGEMLAFFSSSGFLEIAINMGNASELLGISLNDMILVDFNE